MVGGAPFASATRTVPLVTCRICQDAFPNWKMSPALLSMAKSSFSVPMNVSPGSRSDPIVGDLGDGSARTSARAVVRLACREQFRAPRRDAEAQHAGLVLSRIPRPPSSRRHRNRRASSDRYGHALRASSKRSVSAFPPASQAADFGHDLLRQHVQRRVVLNDCIELAAPNRAEERRALHQVVA